MPVSTATCTGGIMKSEDRSPEAPGSQLRNMLKKLEQRLKFKTRFRYCEEMGRSVRELLVKKDPSLEHCGRDACFP